MSVKIVIHLSVEISDDGRVSVSKASWTPTRGGGDRRPVRTEEVTAIAAAVIRTQTTTMEDLDEPPDAEPLIDASMELPFDQGPPAHQRGQYLAGPGASQGPPGRPPAAAGPPPAAAAAGTSVDWAVQCLVSAGVTAVLARQLAEMAGAARAAEIGVWMRDKAHIRNKDALASKVLLQQNGRPGPGRVV